MSDIDRFIALNRFGFGGDLNTVRGDPKKWLRSQLDINNVKNPYLNKVPNTDEAYRMTFVALKRNKNDTKQKRQEKRRAGMRKIRGQLENDIYARTMSAATSPTPYIERLVQFWSNHFTISTTTKGLAGMVGSFEKDAIRPYILGNFGDMLMAVTKHPAMLRYLDNVSSIGPNSKQGARRGKGLNENLAREILELHSLGVNGGYSQEDIIEFAKVLTGWGENKNLNDENAKAFLFSDAVHEPGPKKILNKIYNENGMKEGEQVLRDLVKHPATAKFIATKLARHFVSDDPSDAVVNRLMKVFIRSNGNLLHLSNELIFINEIWREPLNKFKTPNDYIISVARILSQSNETLPKKRLMAVYKMLNQMPFSALSPAGWDDDSRKWVSSDGLRKRIDVNAEIANIIRKTVEPADLMNGLLGDTASANTQFIVLKAGSKTDAIALLLSSPEFQRR